MLSTVNEQLRAKLDALPATKWPFGYADVMQAIKDGSIAERQDLVKRLPGAWRAANNGATGKKYKRFGVIYSPEGEALEYSCWGANLVEGSMFKKPARTCSHGCLYCYNGAGKENLALGPTLKEGLLDRLREELPKAKEYIEHNNRCSPDEPTERVHMSFVGDPYDLELPEGTIRSVLEEVSEAGVPFQILTKAGMRAAQDFGLYGPNDRFGVTLTLDNEADSKKWEPNAALPEDRMNALKAAHDLGIETWVSLEPALYPEQTLHLIDLTHEYADHYGVGKLNTKGKGLGQELEDLEKSIDWVKFRSDAEAKLQGYGKSYKVKAALIEATAVNAQGGVAGEPTANDQVTDEADEHPSDEADDQEAEAAVGDSEHEKSATDHAQEEQESDKAEALARKQLAEYLAVRKELISQEDIDSIDFTNVVAYGEFASDEDYEKAKGIFARVGAKFSAPKALQEQNHWVLRNGKRPVSWLGKGWIPVPDDEDIGWDNPGFWYTYEDVIEAFLHRKASANITGIGFIIMREPELGARQVIFIDIDGCRDPQTGEVSKWASELLKKLNSATEISSSGTGFHILCVGKLPDDLDRVEWHGPDDLSPAAREHIIDKKPGLKTNLDKNLPAFNHIEIYESNRHIALSFHWLNQFPSECELRTIELAEIIAAAPDDAVKKECDPKKKVHRVKKKGYKKRDLPPLR